MVAQYRRSPLALASRIPTNNLRIRFGGGINARANAVDIADDDCTTGQNFQLTPGRRDVHPRFGIKKVFQAPNNAAIVGYASLKTTNNIITLLLQAGSTVYSWDGVNATSATNVGTVNAAARLRGNANWSLTADKCIITDMALVEVVKEWNGSVLSNVLFTKNNGANSYGSFRAKYCVIHNERALYMNVVDSAGVALPHLVVGSRLGDYKDISTSDRASSAIGAADPWYLPTTSLRPVCGVVSAFGQLVIASLDSDILKLEGSAPENFKLSTLYAGIGLCDYEMMIATGNDIIYACKGVVESLSGVQAYGDVESDDLSFWISPLIETYLGWRVTYNSTRREVYCFPHGAAECWVLSTGLIGQQVSPWSVWRTDSEHSMQPNVVFTAPNPATGEVETYVSDALGGLYQFQAHEVWVDSLANGSTTPILVQRTSKTWHLPTAKSMYYADGTIEYSPNEQQDVTVATNLQGVSQTTHSIDATLLADASAAYFNGEVYFNGDYYFSGPAAVRLIRQSFNAAGQSDMLSCTIQFLADSYVAISAIEYVFEEVG